MPNELDGETGTKLVVLVTLFITGPIIFFINIHIAYKIFSNELDISSLGLKGKAGLVLMFIGAPVFIFYCVKHAKESYGWFGGKKNIN